MCLCGIVKCDEIIRFGVAAFVGVVDRDAAGCADGYSNERASGVDAATTRNTGNGASSCSRTLSSSSSSSSSTSSALSSSL